MDILQPVVALAAWTMVMWAWMYATRIPAMIALDLEPDRLARDPEATLDRLLAPQIQWKAHNYNHLHEAPTVFYAIAIVLAIIGRATATTRCSGGSTSRRAWSTRWSRRRSTASSCAFAVFAFSSLVLIA
jgi:hypothetical protein